MLTIINAACKHPYTGKIVAGSSHYDAWMKMFPDWSIIDIAAYTRFDRDTSLEGFVTSDGGFVSRREALLIALAAKQVNVRGGMLCRSDANEAILISEATTYHPAA